MKGVKPIIREFMPLLGIALFLLLSIGGIIHSLIDTSMSSQVEISEGRICYAMINDSEVSAPDAVRCADTADKTTEFVFICGVLSGPKDRIPLGFYLYEKESGDLVSYVPISDFTPGQFCQPIALPLNARDIVLTIRIESFRRTIFFMDFNFQ